MRLFTLLLLFAVSASAQLSFQTILGDQTNLKPIIDAWKAEVLAQDGDLSRFWLHGIALCDFDIDGDLDIIASTHTSIGGGIFINQFVPSGILTFTDETLAYTPSRQQMPPGDEKNRCVDGDRDGRPDLFGVSDETIATGYWNDPGGLTLMDNTFGRKPTDLQLNKDELSGFRDITGDGYLDIIRWEICPVLTEHVFDPNFRKYFERSRTYDRPSFPQAIEDKITAFCSYKANATHVSAYEYQLNGDGLMDIVLTGHRIYDNSNPDANWMRLMIQQGDGSFVDETVQRGFVGDSAAAMIADLSGDGIYDFMAYKGTQPGYYRSQPNGTWVRELGHCGTPPSSQGGTLEYFLSTFNQVSPTHIRPLDFDSDGDLDVPLHNTNPTGRMRLCENRGAGVPMGMLINITTRAWRGSGGMDIGDVNNDCKPDIVYGHPDPLNHSTTSITIYLNTSPNEPPPCVDAPLPPPPSAIVHPKLLLTEPVLMRLKSKQAAADPDWLAVKAEADRFVTYTVVPYARTGCPLRSICYTYQGHGWLNPLRSLGVAYRVTGDIAYANKIIEIMDAANAPFKATGSVEPESNDTGYPSRNVPFGMALAFDWVYDRLDATRKTDTINSLNAWCDWALENGFGREKAYDNYFGGHVLGCGAAAYTTSDDNPRAQEFQNRVREMFNAYVVPAFASGGFQGGYMVESYNYGPALFAYLIQYLQIVKDNTGEDLGLSAYGPKLARNLLYNLKPNRWQSTDEGDYPGNFVAVMPGFLPLMLAAVLEGTTEAKWMQWFYTHMATPPLNAINLQTPDPYFRLLYGDSTRESLDYRLTVPTFLRSLGDEHVFARSSWADDAVWASFAAGGETWASHESRKAGHIALSRGADYLLVNSGQWAGETGLAGTPSAFSLAGWHVNTLFFDDFGAYNYVGGSYTGGQGYWGTNNILAFDAGTNYVYSKADLTSAYDRTTFQQRPALRSLRSFVRSFLYLGDNYIAVWDRAVSLMPSYTKKLFWHINPMGGAPVIDGNLVKSTIGDSTVWIKSLLPAAPVIAIAQDGTRLLNDPPFVTYRAEVSDSVPSADFKAFTILAATGNQEPLPAISKIEVTSTNMVGALIADVIPRAVLFSEDGTEQSDVTYRAEYSGMGRHIITDLIPGTYRIQMGGQDIVQPISTTPAGILSFNAPGECSCIPEGGDTTFVVEQVPGE